MAIQITTDVTITEVHTHRTEDGQVQGYASFQGEGDDRLKEFSGTLPVSALGGHSLVHVGQVWRVQFDYPVDPQPGDE